MKMNPIDKISYLLVVIGGLNWGLVGFFEYNLVDKIFGVDSGVSRIIYAVVGVAALYMFYTMVVMIAGDNKKA